MGQTTVRAELEKQRAGRIEENAMKKIDSLVSEETTAEIPFGTAVVLGTDKETQVLIPHTSAASAASNFAGICGFDQAFERLTELGEDGLKPGTMIPVLQMGRIRVVTEETVNVGDAVRFRAVAAGAEVAGAFRTTADGSDTVDISNFARYVRGGSTTSPAVVEINMTMVAQASADS